MASVVGGTFATTFVKTKTFNARAMTFALNIICDTTNETIYDLLNSFRVSVYDLLYFSNNEWTRGSSAPYRGTRGTVTPACNVMCLFMLKAGAFSLPTTITCLLLLLFGWQLIATK